MKTFRLRGLGRDGLGKNMNDWEALTNAMSENEGYQQGRLSFDAMLASQGWTPSEYYTFQQSLIEVLPPGFSVMKDCGESENWTDEQGNTRGGYRHGCDTWYIAPNGMRFVEAFYPPSQAGDYARAYIQIANGKWIVPYELANKLGASKDGFLDTFMVNFPIMVGTAVITAGASGFFDQFIAPGSGIVPPSSPIPRIPTPSIPGGSSEIFSPSTINQAVKTGTSLLTRELLKPDAPAPRPLQPVTRPIESDCWPVCALDPVSPLQPVNLPAPISSDTLKWLLTAAGILLSLSS